jgi:hypothetical protein
MTVSVGSKQFEFKKPTMKHLRFLAIKEYEAWLASDALRESVSSDENYDAFTKKWKEFCVDVFVQYGEELDFENMQPADINFIVTSFFGSLAGTPPAQEKPILASQDSKTPKPKE